MNSTKGEDIEIILLLEALYQRYGFDFRDYSRASLKRRIKRRVSLDGFSNISQMQHRLLNDAAFLDTLLQDLSINTTEMFRDPGFYLAMRKEVVPILKTYPSIKIWVAGCSTGEEVYSTAILLTEEGLYRKSIIYATDFNDHVLEKAREGIFPIKAMKHCISNYQKSGGEEEFSKYYMANKKSVIMSRNLSKNIVFANHNLVTDAAFGEMNLIICRNVLIYFNRKLQGRVHRLFHESLVRKGILCLGSKETIDFSGSAHHFQTLDDKEKIYEKKD
ncbi:MAG: CheR family methyltransferase [Thermodesulfobacteriota bacterium]